MSTPEPVTMASIERRLQEITALKAADEFFDDRSSLQDLLIEARNSRLSSFDRFEIIANVELVYARRNLDSGHIAAALSISTTTRSHLERSLQNCERIGRAELRMVELVMRFRFEVLQEAGDHITMVEEMGRAFGWMERVAETDEATVRLGTTDLLLEILDRLRRADHEALVLPETEALVRRIRSVCVRMTPRSDAVIRVMEDAKGLDRLLSSMRGSGAGPGSAGVCKSCGLKVELFSARCRCS